MPDPLEPIAVVGIGLRFPGAAHDLDSLWKLLIDGREAWSDVPPTRFRWESFSHPSRGANSAHGHRGGHFLEQNIAAFDASFFGVSAAEAEAVDPQQRLLLEVAYEALENAGISSEAIHGSDTGVYIATFTHDYENMMYKDAITFPKYSMTGAGLSIVSNRVSYVFDLRGPSLTLDTGCSGGLVALHQACQSLRSGESSMALAGGTNLIISPDTMIPMDLLHLLNQDGKCYSFDSQGAGYGRGEGVAVVALKRLDDAVRAGDTVHAVIRGSGIGQDGKTAGITLPSAQAQQDLIQSTYRAAGLNPLETAYVEAHGTGTAKGDLAEVQALANVFCDSRAEGDILHVDSIKANIGHLESVSGLAGLIKTILVLQKGIITPNSKLKSFKDELAPFASKLKIPREPVPWPRGRPRRASINSFGYGGTNSHVIIEHPQCIPNLLSVSLGANDSLRYGLPKTPYGLIKYENSQQDQNGILHDRQRFQILTLSAKSSSSLLAYVPKLKSWAEEQGTINIRDLTYTLNERRSLMRTRLATVIPADAGSLDTLHGEAIKSSKLAPKQKITFVFSGQGAQWYGMARELLTRSLVFRQSISRSDGFLQQIGASWSLIGEMMQDEHSSHINDSQFAQPITTAVQIGVVDLLRSLAVQPDHVVGHSSGEIAAAYAAGALDQEGALTVAYHRGSLARLAENKLSTKGAMLAVGLSEEEVVAYFSKVQGGRVSVACSNSPTSTTISGDAPAIEELEDLLKRFAISARKLKVDTAYHSPHMTTVASEYAHQIRNVRTTSTNDAIQFHSTVTGQVKTSAFGPDYWVSNLTSKVRFRDAVERLCESLAAADGEPPGATFHAFLEIGAHSTLSLPIKQTISQLEMSSFRFGCLATLIRGRDAELTLLKSVSTLFELGWAVDIAQANRLDGNGTVSSVISNLPHYVWDHSKEFWWESRVSKEHRFRSHPYHDLLGVRTPGDHLFEPTWRHFVSVDTLPWIRDHGVQGRLVFPGAGYLAMAIEAKLQITADRHGLTLVRGVVLKDVVFSKLLELPDNSDAVELQISLRAPLQSKNRTALAEDEFRISSITASGIASEHCHGKIEIGLAEPSPENYPQSNKSVGLSTQLRPSILYTDLEDMGHLWGPTFALIDEIQIGGYDAQGTVCIPDIAAYMPGHVHQSHIIHPTTLDALIHSTLIIYARTCAQTVMVPVGIERMVISTGITTTPGDKLTFESTLVPGSGLSSNSSAAFDVSVYTASSSRLCLQIKNGQLRGAVKAPALDALDVLESLYSSLEYRPDIDLNFSVDDTAVRLFDSEEENQASDRIRLLNQAALYYTTVCLERLSPSSIAPRHQKYFQWILELQKQGAHNGLSGPMFENPADASIFETLGGQKDALSRLGMALPDILTGNIDPLSLLLEDELLQRIYAEDASAMKCAADLARYMQQFAFKYPNLHVLEIGAGTGGATLPLLEAVGGADRSLIEKYDFTDVSSGFFEAARTKLLAWEQTIQFKTLDISKDPIRQGFTEHSYDVVIAYNALHVTNSIDSAISNARKLLKPAGKLILIEITQLVRYMNAIFGLLPGWYLDRSDGRKASPVLTIEQWGERLVQPYFSGIDYQKRDYKGSGHQMTLIVATASMPNNETHHAAATLLSLDSVNNDLLPTTSFNRDDTQLEIQLLAPSFWSLDSHKFDDGAIYIIIDGPELSTRLGEFLESLLSSNTRILFIKSQTRNTLASRSLARRNASADVITVYVDMDRAQGWSNVFEIIPRIIYGSFLAPEAARSKEKRYFLINGEITIPRLVPGGELSRITLDSSLEAPSLKSLDRDDNLGNVSIGNIKSLEAIETTASVNPEITPQAGDVHIQVHAYGFSLEKQQIVPFAGTVIASGAEADRKIGDHVCGWTKDASKGQVHSLSTDLCQLPPSIPFAAACSMLSPYSLAYYALITFGSLRQGQCILIHNSNQLLGHALLEICQWAGGQVIITVDTEEELQELRGNYPRATIIIGKDRHFSYEVLQQTSNRGADIVIDTLGASYLPENVKSAAEFGKYIQFSGSGGLREAFPLCDFSERNLTYTSINWMSLVDRRPGISTQLFQVVVDLLHKGYVKYLPGLKIFPVQEAEEATQTALLTGTTEGIVLEYDKKVDNISGTQETEILRNDGTYIIVGELGGLGLDLCHYAISRGARQLILLSTSHATDDNQIKFRSYFDRAGTNALIYLWEDPEWVLGLGQIAANMPSVRGIILADTASSPDDTQKDIQAYVRRLCILPLRARSLIHGLGSFLQSHNEIDFALAVCTSGQAMTPPLILPTFPQSGQVDNASKNIRGAVIIAPSIKDLTLSHQDRRSTQDLAHTGFIPISKSQLYDLMDQNLGNISGAAGDSWRHVVAGINRRSLTTSGNIEALDIPIFSQLPRLDKHRSTNTNDSKQKPVERDLGDARSMSEAQSIIVSALQRKISSLVVVEHDMLDLGTAIEDFGLDSLIMFSFRSWIVQSFRSGLEPTEISDAPNILALAEVILSRSSLARQLKESGLGSESSNNISTKPEVPEMNHPKTSSVASDELPRQPLPELTPTFNALLDAIKPICSKEELERTTRAIASFHAPGSMGVKLQERLVQRFKDPNVENWLTGLYTTNRFLRPRGSLVPFQTYFGSHPNSSRRHSQAQRAAIVSLAAFRFKQRQESGQLELQHLSGQAIDPASSRYIFNSCRVPGATQDVLTKYPSNDYITVLCRGHIFKVNLRDQSRIISLEALMFIFHDIKASAPREVPFLGSLSADQRTSWANVKAEVASLSSENQHAIETIESSAFVVCLDALSPVTPEQRFRQFLSLADKNRWYDKSLQFVVCENGTSGSVMEHAALDGVAVEPLHEALNKAIREHDVSLDVLKQDSHIESTTYEPLPLSIGGHIHSSISAFRESFRAAATNHTFAVLDDTNLGNSFIEFHKWPLQSTIQLAIQLASRRFFGYSPFSMETVSMAHYRDGRVEVNPIIRHAMSRFLDAASKSPLPSKGSAKDEVRSLAYAAAREHVKFLTRAGKGRAFGRHILAMEWVRQEDEPVPDLFTDPGYLKSKAAKVLTSSFSTGWLEGGFVYPVPGGVLVYFEIKEHSVSYSIFGNAVEASEFRVQLARASEDVRTLFDDDAV